MKYIRKGDHIIARLYPGEGVHDSLAEMVEKEGVRGAAVLCGIGMLTDFTLGYFSVDGYSTRTFDTPHELVGLHGTIAFAEEGGADAGVLKIHLHASLAGPGHTVVGGHLDKGEVMVLNEIVLYCPEGLELLRKRNPETGLFELEL